MNFVLHGHAVSGGITVGYAHLVATARLEVAHYEVAPEAVDAELARFDRAMQTAQQELQDLKAHIPPDAPKEFEAFLDLHRMILNDSALAQAPRELIRSRRSNAEWALVQQMERLVERFDEIDDPYLRERKADVQHAVERVLKALMGAQTIAEPAVSEEQKLIVVAHDLSPADMILFKRHRYGGFVTDVGGVTSHTAIVARSLAIPAIVGLHHAFQTISEGELLIVDGERGLLVVNPDPVVLAEYRERQAELKAERQRLKRLKRTRATTQDGTPIELYANIELPQDTSEVLEAGAEGVGHFRTVRILLPMVAHAHEIDQTLVLIAQAKQQLEERDQPYDRAVQVGGMIEIPAAALALPIFMRRLHFLSIGTNDLIQYTLAIDRTDDAVAHLYDPLHPAVLTLVANTTQTATRGGLPIAVCGEMAGDLQLTRLLLGLGLRNFSMHPSQLLAIKERILRTNLGEVQAAAQRVLRNTDPAKTRDLLAKLNS